MKQIFEEIANESSTNQKMVILSKYKDNELLQKVLYAALSKRVKYYIKQIPEYTYIADRYSLEQALEEIKLISERKLTGGAALSHLSEVLSLLSEDNAYIIERIIDKNPKIGMGRSNINKIMPNLIEKTPYQGAKSYSEKLAKAIFKNDGYAYSDIKMDGRYANAIIQNGDVELESRQGETTHIPKDSILIRELSKFPDGVLHGELTMVGLDRYTSNGIIASIVDIEGKREERGEVETNKKIAAFVKKRGNYKESIDKVRFTIWDSITVNNYFEKKSDSFYNRRRGYIFKKTPLLECTRVSFVETKKVYSFQEAMAHFQEALERGEEGTILKAPNATWKDGKPNWQVKMKLEIDVDLIIVGFNYGTGKNLELISSLSCESSCGLVKTRPTGINESMMKHITENQDSLLNTVLEVKCSGLSNNSDGEYSLLHPVFKVLRDDKDDSDSLEQIKRIEQAAKELV